MTPPEPRLIPIKVDIKYLIRTLIKFKASDLHLKAARPPLLRVNGQLVSVKLPPFSPQELEAIVFEIMSSKQKKDLLENKQVDFSFPVVNLGRFRCNAYYQRGSLAAAIRMIPLAIPSLNHLGLPVQVLQELCKRPKGLVLITGATGSGKSTTMAAVIQWLNETSPIHILCIEDPIEFVYRDQKASITQREIGTDTPSIHSALTGGLRQDPDVIVIGEMRDFETIQTALMAAETGHLVISTLHTHDAKGTIHRIIESFPLEAQNQARIQLASTLVGTVSQQLLLKKDGSGLVPACEVMIKSPAIEKYLIKNDLDKITEAIASSNTYYKMQTMNQSLEKLLRSEVITLEEALKVSLNPDDLNLRLAGVSREEGYHRP